MAQIDLTKPYALKSATFSIGADDYTAAVSQVLFRPSVPRSEWRGIGGYTLVNQGVATWTAELGFAQDLAPEGLLRYLHENEGQVAEVTFVPLEDGPAIKAELVLAPADIGGTAGPDTATSSVSLGVIGKPTFEDTPEP